MWFYLSFCGWVPMQYRVLFLWRIWCQHGENDSQGGAEAGAVDSAESEISSAGKDSEPLSNETLLCQGLRAFEEVKRENDERRRRGV